MMKKMLHIILCGLWSIINLLLLDFKNKGITMRILQRIFAKDYITKILL